MTATLSERTVLPPADPGRVESALAALVRASVGQAALVGPDGSRVELPPDVYELLRDVLEALSQGLAITLAPVHTVLTTSEAAQLLGISRPTLVRLLEAGEIPYEQPSRHRRVRLADVLAYQERAKRARAAGLDEMVRASEEAGLYDPADDMPFERLPGQGRRGQLSGVPPRWSIGSARCARAFRTRLCLDTRV
jgi:excisionase family DNA binding protein